MLMKFHSGKFEILATGTVISFKEEAIEIEFRGDLKLTFSFRADEGKRRLETVEHSEKSMEFILYNFGFGLTEGNIEPILIGKTNEGKKIYLNFRILRLNEAQSRTLDFTIYQENG